MQHITGKNHTLVCMSVQANLKEQTWAPTNTTNYSMSSETNGYSQELTLADI